MKNGRYVSEELERVILEIRKAESGHAQYSLRSDTQEFDYLQAREDSFELIVDNLLLRFLAAPSYRKNFELAYAGDVASLTPPQRSVLEHLVHLQNRTAPLIRAAEELEKDYKELRGRYVEKE